MSGDLTVLLQVQSMSVPMNLLTVMQMLALMQSAYGNIVAHEACYWLQCEMRHGAASPDACVPPRIMLMLQASTGLLGSRIKCRVRGKTACRMNVQHMP